MEPFTGVIRVGYAADLVVLNGDPFTRPIDTIGHTTVDMTFVDGVCVHDAGQTDALRLPRTSG